MSYETYVYIKSLIEKDVAGLDNDYMRAFRFIPSESYNPKKLSGMDKAQKIYSDEWAKRKKMSDEFHSFAAATYKDHPDPEMRKFWGLE